MKINLLHNTPLWVCSKAIRKCWASEGKSDIYKEYMYQDGDITITDHQNEIYTLQAGSKDKELIERIGNKNKHSSTLEHLVYSFDIDGISRACLQELARHRIASLSVKSTRYTLKELKNEEPFLNNDDIDRVLKYCVIPNLNSYEENDLMIAEGILHSLEILRKTISKGIKNDIAKFCLPEAYKTSLVWTINARSLQNFLSLRTSSSALWEIRDLANEIFNVLPEDHKYLFKDNLSLTN